MAASQKVLDNMIIAENPPAARRGTWLILVESVLRIAA